MPIIRNSIEILPSVNSISDLPSNTPSFPSIVFPVDGGTIVLIRAVVTTGPVETTVVPQVVRLDKTITSDRAFMRMPCTLTAGTPTEDLE